MIVAVKTTMVMRQIEILAFMEAGVEPNTLLDRVLLQFCCCFSSHSLLHHVFFLHLDAFFTVVAKKKKKKFFLYALDTVTQSGNCQFHCYNSINT